MWAQQIKRVLLVASSSVLLLNGCSDDRVGPFVARQKLSSVAQAGAMQPRPVPQPSSILSRDGLGRLYPGATK